MFEGNLSPMQMYYIKLQQATICKYIIGGIIACFLLLHLEHIHKIMKIYNNVLWDWQYYVEYFHIQTNNNVMKGVWPLV